MGNKTYGFKIGKHIIDIKSHSEQEAFRLLGVNFWHLISNEETIELLGELKPYIAGKKTTGIFVDELPNQQESEQQ